MSLGPAPCARESCANARAAACRARVPPPPPAPDMSGVGVRFRRASAKPASKGDLRCGRLPRGAPPLPPGIAGITPHGCSCLVLKRRERLRATPRALQLLLVHLQSVGASLSKVTDARSRAAAAAAGGGMGMPSCVARVAVSFAVPLSCNPLPVRQTGSPGVGADGLSQARMITSVMFDEGHT
jgi:hypothetical protein